MMKIIISYIFGSLIFMFFIYFPWKIYGQEGIFSYYFSWRIVLIPVYILISLVCMEHFYKLINKFK